MANKDMSLFAGLEVGGKLIPQNEDQVARAVVSESEISPLFAGLEVGGVLVQPQQQPQQQQQSEGQPEGPVPAQVAPASRPSPTPSPFPEPREETRAVKDLPELGRGGLLAGEDAAKVAKVTPVLLATTDPQEMANILKATFPESIGIQFDPGGNIIAANNKNGSRVVVNQPGLSQLDVLQAIGITAAFSPAGRAAAVPAGVLGKVAAGAVGSGLTQGGIEVAQEAVGGDIDKGEIGMAAALGGAAEGILPAGKAILEARRAKALGVESADIARTVEQIKPAREAMEGLAQASGVDVPLFQAQQTMNPSTLLKQRLMPQLSAGSRKAAAELAVQNKAAFDAAAELISSIAPSEALERGSERFRTVAQTAIAAAKERRSDAVKDLYNESLEVGADVDLTSVRGMIDEMLADAPPGGEFEKTANKLLQRISSRVEGGPPSLRQLQKAKQEMGDMIDAVGEKAVSPSLKRDITIIKKQLTDDMSAASPLFRQAEDRFAELSPAVTALEKSVIGQVSKMDDLQLKNIAGKIFDATQTDPTVITRTKQIIDETAPGAWDDLMRVELQRRVGGIQTLIEDLPGELVGNMPGQLRSAIFGNPQQRRVLLAGMSDEQRKNFVYLDDVLRRASSGRAAGSPTTPFKEALDKLRGVTAAVASFVFGPIKSTREAGQQAFFDKNVSKLTDVLFNPKWEPKLKELRSANPKSEKAKKIMLELFEASKGSVQTQKPEGQE